VIFLKNKSVITIFMAAAVLLITAFGSQVKFSGATYDSSPTLPERSPFVLRSSGGDKFNINTISENMLKTLPRVGKYAKEMIFE
jgi:DNA uptake protein ComE-like DNA-binding protein